VYTVRGITRGAWLCSIISRVKQSGLFRLTEHLRSFLFVRKRYLYARMSTTAIKPLGTDTQPQHEPKKGFTDRRSL
jgi:hypothetical protein